MKNQSNTTSAALDAGQIVKVTDELRRLGLQGVAYEDRTKTLNFIADDGRYVVYGVNGADIYNSEKAFQDGAMPVGDFEATSGEPAQIARELRDAINGKPTTSAAGATQPAIEPALLAMYLRCRKEKPFMLVGRDAECSLSSARTILAFRDAEKRGLVRMRAEAETENYFDVFGDEMDDDAKKEMEDIIDRLGCWWTVAEWYDGEEWQQADSCGMHTGYRDPLDPFQNCYVIGEMQSALDALQAHIDEQEAESAESFACACRDVATV